MWLLGAVATALLTNAKIAINAANAAHTLERPLGRLANDQIPPLASEHRLQADRCISAPCRPPLGPSMRDTRSRHGNTHSRRRDITRRTRTPHASAEVVDLTADLTE